MPSDRSARVDTHAHYLPEGYLHAARGAYPNGPDGIPGFPPWNLNAHLEAMDSLGIVASVLSVSSPGVHFGDDADARALARDVNEEGAAAVRSYPGRFGLFATLPLPDVDGALAEIEHAFDELHADGVVMLTNARGVYLGDEHLEPVFDELNRRRAVVFMHPTSPYCPACQGATSGLPGPILDFMFDSTRAVSNLILSGTLARCPEIRLIVPHAGATLPALAERIAAGATMLSADGGLDRAALFAALRGLHYDLAGFPLPTLLRALLDIADTERVLYGSDWPFTPLGVVQRLASGLEETDLLDEDTRRKVYRDNAMHLLPRLGAASDG
jgi:predicted TIM-barrel fold metal-dependent hydrolase